MTRPRSTLVSFMDAPYRAESRTAVELHDVDARTVPELCLFGSTLSGWSAERCRSFDYLRIGLDVVGILRNGCGMSPATISKAPAP